MRAVFSAARIGETILDRAVCRVRAAFGDVIFDNVMSNEGTCMKVSSTEPAADKGRADTRLKK